MVDKINPQPILSIKFKILKEEINLSFIVVSLLKTVKLTELIRKKYFFIFVIFRGLL